MEKILNALIGKMQAVGKHFEISNKYKELETDQDRIIFTLDIMRDYNIIPNVTGTPKNVKESEDLREQGNQIFVKSGSNKSSLVEALRLYTKSIAFAPYSSIQLGLAYANRSAVLYKVGLYSECILDIERALALNYPDNLKAKIYIRKIHCLVLLDNQSLANDMIKETECLLKKMSLSKDQTKLQVKLDDLNKTVKMNAKIYDKYDNIEQEKVNQFLPTIASPNNEVPCASDAVAIKYNENFGRHVVATRDIHPGEVISVEEPYSILLTQANMQTHCSNCLKVCWANIPCKYCTYAMYCSEECRDIEWKKCHDIECMVFPALVEYSFLNSDLFSLRLAVFAVREAGGIQELRTMLNKADEWNDPRTKGFSQDGELHSDKYISLYNLVRNTKKRSISDLFRRSLDSSFILYLLATRTTMFGTKLPEDLSILVKNNDVMFLGGLILRHQQIIPNNIHSVNEERDLDSVQCGIAALPFLSLINHGCNPNITRHSITKHIVVCATFPIKKDEQLLDNYGDHYAVTPKAVRQKNLWKQYFFSCDCIACQEDWPMYLDLKSYKSSVKKADVKSKIERALRKFKIYVDQATKDEVLDKPLVIKDLLTMIQILYDYAPMPCEEMSNVVETLKRIYALSGNRFVMPKLITLS